MKVTAILKTLTPLHITAPSNMRVDSSSGEITYSSEATPVISVQRMAILNPKYSSSQAEPAFEPDQSASGQRSAVDLDDEDAIVATLPPAQEGQASDAKKAKPQYVLRVPVISANNIAGHLRRHAASFVLDALRARGEHVSLAVYSCLQSGAWTGKPDAADITYDEHKRARQHPYLGLFGGGPRMVEKGFATHSALPAQGWIREHLRVSVGSTEPMADMSPRDLTQIAFFRRNDDLSDMVNLTQAAGSIMDFEKSMQTYQAAVLEDKQNERKSRVSCFTFSAIEFVVPGVSFDMGFDLLDDLSPAQVGLFLLSLDRFAERDTMGGWGRNGFGRFALDAVEIDGHKVFDNGRLNRGDSKVMGWISAWESAASEMTSAELAWLFRQGQESAARKKDKEGKKAEKAGAKETMVSKLEALVSEQAAT